MYVYEKPNININMASNKEKFDSLIGSLVAKRLVCEHVVEHLSKSRAPLFSDLSHSSPAAGASSSTTFVETSAESALADLTLNVNHQVFILSLSLFPSQERIMLCV